MNQANVISVNPGVKTLGELHVSDHKIARISRTLAAPRHIANPLRAVTNALLGINSRVNARFSGKMLLIRMIGGALLLFMGLPALAATGFDLTATGTEALIECGAGLLLILGLFCRMSSAAAAGWFGYSFYMSLMAGLPDVGYAALSAVMLIFVVLGPGRFCIDQFIRRGVYALGRLRRSRNRRQHGLDYRAYAMMDRRVG